jgi:hypothetical protein
MKRWLRRWEGQEIKVHTSSDDSVVRVDGKWLTKEMKAGLVPDL